MNETAFKILKILEEKSGPVSGEEISSLLGVTRSAVWKQIRELRELGYTINASRSEGYNLTGTTDKLLPYEVSKRLKTKFIGKEIRYFPTTPSTTAEGKKICNSEDPGTLHGTVLIAELQTGGTGRLGRSWASPPGGVWTTILLKPEIPMDHLFMITMAAAVAIARAIRKEYDLGTLIKWPNDIYIGEKKVSGILLELAAEADTVHYCLLGVGIDANVSPDELPEDLVSKISSLSSEVGHDVDRAALLARFLKEFERRYLLIESDEYESIIREWKSLSMTLDHRVHIKTPRKTFVGEAIDIDEYGALIIRKDNGKIERVIAGDCSPVR